MNMISNLLGGLVSDEDKQNAITEIIQESLEDTAEELGCSHKDMFYMIKPYNEDFDFKIYIYHIDKTDLKPKMIREIPLSEIMATNE